MHAYEAREYGANVHAVERIRREMLAEAATKQRATQMSTYRVVTMRLMGVRVVTVRVVSCRRLESTAQE